MARRPTHEGTVTVKDGDKWKKIGECVAWINDDNSVSGVLTVGEVKTNFRAWDRRDRRGEEDRRDRRGEEDRRDRREREDRRDRREREDRY